MLSGRLENGPLRDWWRVRCHFTGEVAANARSSSGVRHDKVDAMRRTVKYAFM